MVISLLDYYLIEKWLEDFAYRTNINPVIFPLAGLLAILFAFLMVSFHSLRAAQANPVQSLEYG